RDQPVWTDLDGGIREPSRNATALEHDLVAERDVAWRLVLRREHGRIVCVPTNLAHPEADRFAVRRKCEITIRRRALQPLDVVLVWIRHQRDLDAPGGRELRELSPWRFLRSRTVEPRVAP